MSALLISGAIATSFTNGALAQLNLIPDTARNRNLGTKVVPLTPQTDLITGGTRHQNGLNLFHSFSEFNIHEGRGVYFDNPAGVKNILSRVTGSDPSNILGTLGIKGGNANLFLINPKGMIFGPNASLDVNGSFVATTANAIQFGSQGVFRASAPDALPLLTVNPSAFLFSQIAAGPIINNSKATAGLDPSGVKKLLGLRVPDGRSLVLAGGNVRLDGGGLNALGGQVELGGVAGVGTIGLNVDDNSLSLRFPKDLVRAEVLLINDSKVIVSAANGGSIAINARNLNVLASSELQAGIGKGLGSVDSQAGDITLDVTGAINVKNNSFISNAVQSEATGHGGNINITTGSLSVIRSRLNAITSGQGNAGSVTIHADTVSFKGPGFQFPSGAFVSVFAKKATGRGGNINITTGSLSVTEGSRLSANTNSIQSGADISGGNITLKVSSLEVLSGGQILAVSRGSGNAGSITIEASDSVTLDGRFDGKLVGGEGRESKLLASTKKKSTGQGGSLRIDTGKLIVRNGAEVTVSNQGVGSAGSLDVTAHSIRLDKGILSADTKAGQGNIELRSQDLVLRRGSTITTKATRKATGGNIIINTGVLAALENGDISANAQKGRGGRVIIDAQGIFRSPDSDITASSDLGPKFSGIVETNTPDVDPSQGLVALPEEVVDASGLIAQGCAASGGIASREESKFVVTGRGGLPPTPRETVSNETVLEDWGKFSLASGQAQSTKRMLGDRPQQGDRPQPHSNSRTSTDPTLPTPASIVEAQGWAIAANGEVVLMAEAPTGTPHSPQLAIPACPGD